MHCRLAPYERRVIELLRNSKDKRARKLAKKRVCGQYPPLHVLRIIFKGSEWLTVCECLARDFRPCEEEGRRIAGRDCGVKARWSLRGIAEGEVAEHQKTDCGARRHIETCARELLEMNPPIVFSTKTLPFREWHNASELLLSCCAFQLHPIEESLKHRRMPLVSLEVMDKKQP